MAEDASLEPLLLYLKESRGFDFTGYKRSGLGRRISRRMQDVGVATHDEYLDYLQVHAEEIESLFTTILINVTDFFRDPEVWDYLRENVVPDLLKAQPEGRLRVWSAGGASGQEAYSVAILLAELMGVEAFKQRVKIYATDVDDDALNQARLASYTEREMSGLTPEQVATYFERNGSRHAFRADLRKSIIFGRNDLIQNAPISRVDLLTCRNTLMYFNAETQAGVLQRLHFALQPHGVLVLGRAEMLLSSTSLFEPIDLKRRVFRKMPGDAPARPPQLRSLDRVADRADRADPLTAAAFKRGLVGQIVLDREWRLARFNARAEALFDLHGGRDIGRPFADLELSFRPVELRPRVAQAVQEQRTVSMHGVEWIRTNGARLVVDVHVVPLADAGQQVGVSLFFDDVSRFQQLREELQFANGQLETAYEELQSTNEELETTNEELQSTNEELETMNEELQSMNDELQTTNDDLRERTGEVAELNRFSESVLGSLSAGVIVVDRDLRVRVVNRRAEDLWGLRHDDTVGEHLFNLDIGLPLARLKPIMRSALAVEDGQGPAQELTLDAVNRRGRPIVVRVTVSSLRAAGDEATGAIVVTDPHQDAIPESTAAGD